MTAIKLVLFVSVEEQVAAGYPVIESKGERRINPMSSEHSAEFLTLRRDAVSSGWLSDL